MDRFPIIIVLGAALLGWVAGEMAISDPSIAGWVADRHALHTVVPALGAMLVVAVGKWLAAAVVGGARSCNRPRRQATRRLNGVPA